MRVARNTNESDLIIRTADSPAPLELAGREAKVERGAIVCLKYVDDTTIVESIDQSMTIWHISSAPTELTSSALEGFIGLGRGNWNEDKLQENTGSMHPA